MSVSNWLSRDELSCESCQDSSLAHYSFQACAVTGANDEGLTKKSLGTGISLPFVVSSPFYSEVYVSPHSCEASLRLSSQQALVDH